MTDAQAAFVDEIIAEVMSDPRASRQSKLQAALLIVARDLHIDAIKQVALEALCGTDDAPKLPFKIEVE